MKFTFKVIVMLCITFVFLTGLSAYAAKVNVAVMDFGAENVSKTDASIINDHFRSQLIRTGKYNVLDRYDLDKILKEEALQSTGATDVNTAVKIGKLLNVHYMFTGTFARLDNLYTLTAYMIDVETGQIEKTADKSTSDPSAKSRLDLATYIAYSFSGFGVGYELFWDGNRVGFEPEWSYDAAVKNLDWNRKTYPDRKVEGYFNGKKMP